MSGVEVKLSDDGETGLFEVAIHGVDREGVAQLRQVCDDLDALLAQEESA